MFGSVKWDSTRKNLGFVNFKVQTSLCICSLINTFIIRLLVSRLAFIKYTHLFPYTVVSSMIDLILSFLYRA